MRARRRVQPLAHAEDAGKPNGKGTNSRRRDLDGGTIVSTSKRKSLKKQSGKRKHRLAIISAALASLVFLSVILLLRPLSEESMAEALSKNEDVSSFLDWFQQAGGRASNITIAQFEGMGKGVITSADVKLDDELVFVPKEIIICQDTIFAADNSASLPTHDHHTPPDILAKLDSLQDREDELLTAFVLLEQNKGLASRWFPYIRLLPRTPSAEEADQVMSPLFFNTNEEIEQLQDPHMIMIAREERTKAKQGFQRFQQLFGRHLSLTSKNEDITLTHYLWTRFLINSRAFSIQGQRLLVPFGDFFNGQAQQQVREHDNGQHFLKFHAIQNDGMVIRADRTTTKGSQVFEDYGDNDNYIYFLYHGFIMNNNPFDCTFVRLPSVAPGHDDGDIVTWEMKMRVLRHFGVNNGPTVCVSADGSVREMPILRFYLKLYQMNADRMTECDSKNQYMHCFLSRNDQSPEEIRTSNGILKTVIHEELGRYPTTIQQDEQLLDDANTAREINLHAVRFRVSRKRILQAAQAVLKDDTGDKTNEESLNEGTKVIQAEEATTYSPPVLSIEERFGRFKHWIDSLSFPVNHLELRYINDAVGFGTFAAKSLAEGEVYLSVPVSTVMNVRTAVRSRSGWLTHMSRALGHKMSSDWWLTLHLLDESYGLQHKASQWKPYLDMLPSIEDGRMGSPLFYSNDGPEIQMLKHTDLFPLIEAYRQRVFADFEALTTAIESHNEGDLAHLKQWLTLERFLWANAILDSRSIWWGGQRHLVPLLDMVNCRELAPNKQHKAHRTDRNGEFADTRASWVFQAGDEVVENYGQPNYIYLMYHGFVLDENSYDCAHLRMDFRTNIKDEVVKRKVATQLESMGVLGWTWDICVDVEDATSIQNFVRLALLTANPELAVTQGLDSKRTEAAVNAAKTRLDKLRTGEHDSKFQGSAALYVKQQASLMSKLVNILSTLS